MMVLLIELLFSFFAKMITLFLWFVGPEIMEFEEVSPDKTLRSYPSTTYCITYDTLFTDSDKDNFSMTLTKSVSDLPLKTPLGFLEGI